MNAYKILGVASDATPSQIKRAYYTAATKYHPDVCSEKDRKRAEEIFKQINNAYQILSDASCRKIHDEELSDRGDYSTSAPSTPDASTLKRFPREHIKEFWVTLEEIHSGVTVNIPECISGLKNDVEVKVRPGTTSGSNFKLIDDGGGECQLTLRIHPHVTFRRGGGINDPGTSYADIIRSVMCRKGKINKGYFKDLSGGYQYWNLDECFFSARDEITQHRIRGKGFPVFFNTHAKANIRGDLIIEFILMDEYQKLIK